VHFIAVAKDTGAVDKIVGYYYVVIVMFFLAFYSAA